MPRILGRVVWICLAWAGAAWGAMEEKTNRYGSDYQSFQAANAKDCEAACNADAPCKSWTWKAPMGVKFPDSPPRLGVCFLKNAVPPSSHDICCISGVRFQRSDAVAYRKPPAGFAVESAARYHEARGVQSAPPQQVFAIARCVRRLSPRDDPRWTNATLRTKRIENVYKVFSTSGHCECANACDADHNCGSWSYEVASEQCSLLQGDQSPALPDACCISGYKIYGGGSGVGKGIGLLPLSAAPDAPNRAPTSAVDHAASSRAPAPPPAKSGPTVALATPAGTSAATGYRQFIASTFQECQAACAAGAQCKAWTWVKPTSAAAGGKFERRAVAAKGKCWLKSSVPVASHDECCVSGVKLK